MNFIPSAFSEYQIDRTILGGKQINPNAAFDISVIMLNTSGSHLRTQYFESLLNCGFKKIVSVEPDAESYNVEENSHRFPSVKFMIPREKTSDGVLINMAMLELDTKYVLVLRDSFHIPAGFLTRNLAEYLINTDLFCIVPRLLDNKGNGIITNFIPEAYRGKFKVGIRQVVLDALPTLYPFNNIALINRNKFIQMGGYDYSILNPYWQNLDFSIRSWLWGEKIVMTTKFQLAYAEDVPIEESVPDFSYLRFYLKNLLPRFKEDHGHISRFSFQLFFVKSSCGIFEALSQFKFAKIWVEKNQYRFKRDIQYLIENWAELK